MAVTRALLAAILVCLLALLGQQATPAQVVLPGTSDISLIDVPHSAANFTTNGDKTWTVQAADQVNFSILTVGKMRLVNFWLSNTDVGSGTTGTELRIALPFTAAKNAVIVMQGADNATNIVGGRCFTQATWTYIACRTPTDSVWATGTAVAAVRGQLWIEAQ